MDLLRISTAGSVDDGKSTLIGRLLHDNSALTIEQEELIHKKSAEKGLSDLDFSVITDGLVAEREQGITIDVANIYFSTDKRKFIITDSPGHEEYTRNMVTGASTANVSIILVDARKGLQNQSYRHFYISHLLELEEVIFCVNKMDLVNYDEDVYLNIARDIELMVRKVDESRKVNIIPISSLKGDNVVHQSSNTNWYTGPTLNTLIHDIEIHKTDNSEFRYDVQHVLHVQNEDFIDYRGYAGRVISGSIQKGDKVIALPSQKESVVSDIRRGLDVVSKAYSNDSISISLEDEIDISRGSVLIKQSEALNTTKEIKSTIVWMDENNAQPNGKYILQSGSREVLSKISTVEYKVDTVDFNQLNDEKAISTNDIVHVTLKTNKPPYLDHYSVNKYNGLFVLIDPNTNNTVAVGFNK